MSRNLLRLISEEPLTPEQGYRLLNGRHSAAHQAASARTTERVRPTEEVLDDSSWAMCSTLTFGRLRVYTRPSASRGDGKRFYVVEVERIRDAKIIATQRLTGKQYDRFIRGIRRQTYGN